VHTDTLLLLCGCLFTDFDAVAGTAAATTSSQFYALQHSLPEGLFSTISQKVVLVQSQVTFLLCL